MIVGEPKLLLAFDLFMDDGFKPLRPTGSIHARPSQLVVSAGVQVERVGMQTILDKRPDTELDRAATDDIRSGRSSPSYL